MKALVARCHAVRDGKASLKWLALCIDGILTTDVTSKKVLLCFSCLGSIRRNV